MKRTPRKKNLTALMSFRLDAQRLARLFQLSLDASRREGKPVSQPEVLRRLIDEAYKR